MARTFDATIDFATRDLENALYAALEGTLDGDVFTVVIRAEGEGCETALVFMGDEELPALSEGDWCVTADTVAAAAAELRELL